MSSEKCSGCPEKFFEKARKRSVDACEFAVARDETILTEMKGKDLRSDKAKHLRREIGVGKAFLAMAEIREPKLAAIAECEGPYERTIVSDDMVWHEQICGAYEQNHVSGTRIEDLNNNPAAQNELSVVDNS